MKEKLFGCDFFDQSSTPNYIVSQSYQTDAHHLIGQPVKGSKFEKGAKAAKMSRRGRGGRRGGGSRGGPSAKDLLGETMRELGMDRNQMNGAPVRASLLRGRQQILSRIVRTKGQHCFQPFHFQHP